MSIIRSVPVKLTNEEQRQRGTALAGLEKQLAKVKDEKKIAVAGFNTSIKALEGEISDAALVVRSKEEFRNVRCYEEKDYKNSVVRLFREDTNGKVEERAMLEHEHQVDLTEANVEQGALDLDGDPGEDGEQPEPEGEPTEEHPAGEEPENVVPLTGTLEERIEAAAPKSFAERAAEIEARGEGEEPPEDQG